VRRLVRAEIPPLVVHRLTVPPGFGRLSGRWNHLLHLQIWESPSVVYFLAGVLALMVLGVSVLVQVKIHRHDLVET
jgi:hypothetical protein